MEIFDFSKKKTEAIIATLSITDEEKKSLLEFIKSAIEDAYNQGYNQGYCEVRSAYYNVH